MDASQLDQESTQALHETLIEQLTAAIDPREARRRGDSGLEQIAADALSLLEALSPDQIRVRVLSPEAPRDGRTTIEVLIRDIPFVVDTLRLNLRRLGLREILLLHPLLPVERDADGQVVRVGKDRVGDARESYLYCEVPRVEEPARLDEIASELERALGQLQAVVSDHGRMIKALRRHTADIEFCSGVIPGGMDRARKLMGFLDWVADDNFIFLGYRQYAIRREDDEWVAEIEPGSGLGMLRDPSGSRFSDTTRGEEIPEIIQSRLADPRLVFFDKSRSESVIHRSGRLDSVSVKQLDEDGNVCGFGKILGLLTHKAIRMRGSEIALLRDRRDQVLEAIGAEPGSHMDKAAKEAFDSLPVEFLFPFEVEDVTSAVRRIMTAAERQSVEVCALPDPLNRSFFVSAILPRANYEETLREDIRDMLTERFGVTYIDSRSTFLDDHVALIHFFCSCAEDVDLDLLSELERAVEARAARWEDRFERALHETFPASRAYGLVDGYSSAFREEYRMVTTADEAVSDVEHLERLRTGESKVELSLVDDAHGDSATSRLKVFQLERPFLTDLLPVIDHFGLRVVDATLTEVECGGEEPSWIVTFRVRRFDGDSAASPVPLDHRVLDGLRAVFEGRIEDDSLNRLVVGAGLEWRDVGVIRAYLAYATQLGNAPQRDFASDVLLTHSEATHALISLFRAHFDPHLCGSRDDSVRGAVDRLARFRDPIGTYGEDRVFGLLENLVDSTTRTSFFARSSTELEAIVLKVDPSRLEHVPSPVPYAEIFVHAADLEGVHLRGGALARGGIRWSDRVEDFRTEILGLMKTQMVKNGCIVPAGAKGGFVLKRRFESGAEARAEADRQYARFMRCLLSLTDNVTESGVNPPSDVVRHDGDDPYLVVAPDKGTAHLSDVANEVASEHDFWLRDAFASGGSRGYDHKKEGITARGAWVCARRHFLELGLDVETEPYTVAGIGDMSGDVFGNGLLLMRKARLVAAFNHESVFLDPDPDAEVAWEERKQLFELERSTWRDYDTDKLSQGGGVYDRSAKAIVLTPQARELLGIDKPSVSGEEVVRAILRMPVDLLWNGGIGTYVKSSREADSEVGDRSNTSVRVDARELRARVVCEGGNLGLTQAARVEFALAGGRINTDAVDNSAGVDLSDHEVNLKVLVGDALPDEERDRCLRECVEHATEAVLSHSAAQSHCLSLDLRRSRQDPERMVQAAAFLATQAGLDWRVEHLPARDELRARTSSTGERIGYVRPELAVLLGYTKMLVKERLTASELPDQPSFASVLLGYFPESMRTRFEGQIESHRLRREIVATALTNRVVDTAGVTLVPELVREAGASVQDVIAAFFTVDRLLEGDHLRWSIDSQPASEPARLRAQIQLERAIREGARSRLALERRTVLEAEEISHWTGLVRSLRSTLPRCIGTVEAARVEASARGLESSGFSKELAEELAALPALVRSFGVLSLSIRSGSPVPRVAQLHARVGEETHIAWLLDKLAAAAQTPGWDRVAADALYLEMLEVQRDLCEALLEAGTNVEAPDLFDDAQRVELAKVAETVALVDAEAGAGLAPLTLLSRQIRRLC